MFKFQSWLSVNVVLLSMSMHTLSSAIDTVDLGSACKFAILSKSGVTNTGGSDVSGNVGTSPIAATALTGFALTPTTAGDAEFSTSALVTGNLYGASHLAPTPAMLTVAVSAMEAAYTDVSGRPNPDEVELFGGVFPNSAVLAPGIYKWSGVVTVPVGGTLVFDGSSTDKWIMQIAGNLVIGTNASILLSNGAKAENIFWAVAGDIAFNVDAHAEGIFLTYTMIAMKTRSSLNGAAYAQTAVTLDTATIINDTTGPVLSGVPADIMVECDNLPEATDVTATGCDSSPVVSYNEEQSTGSCASGYTLTRTWTAIDANGKTATEAQTITVLATPSSTAAPTVSPASTGDGPPDGFVDGPQDQNQAGGSQDSPAPTPSPPMTTGGVFGDPHFKTWDGQFYDFHGICDLVLLHTPEFMNGVGMDIHIRSTKTRKWSYISRMVVKIGIETFELSTRKDNNNVFIEYFVNGISGKDDNLLQEDDMKLPNTISGYEIQYHSVNSQQKEYIINLGDGETLSLRTWKHMIRIDLEGCGARNFASSVGLMGTFAHSHKVGRDNSTIIENLNEFGQEWQVLPGEGNLFQTVEGPQAPSKCEISSKSQLRRRLSQSEVTIEAAELACASMNNNDDFILCVFDVIATGDVGIVGVY